MMIALMIAAAWAGSEPAAAAATPAVKPKKERIICVEEQFVGSKITRRVCKTKAQWDLLNNSARDVARQNGNGPSERTFPGTPVNGGG